MKTEIFYTIKIGTHQNNRALKKTIISSGNRISPWVKDIITNDTFTLSRNKLELDLVAPSIADLGFKDGAYINDVYSYISRIGLEICPAEVGPQLRLQYTDQPADEVLFIGMKPVLSEHGLALFQLRHQINRLSLEACHIVNPANHTWKAHYRVVFVRPRKKV